MRIVVCGAGLAGLSAAHRLRELAPEHEVIVLEASARAGGLLGTLERDGFVIETGPESILGEKRAAIELAARLGIEHRLVRTREEHRGAYVVNRGRLVRVPEGFSL
ncbi:MAG TPA: FAD-dependent oxidoreductase, partial [Sandaracinaceae bacterium]